MYMIDPFALYMIVHVLCLHMAVPYSHKAVITLRSPTPVYVYVYGEKPKNGWSCHQTGTVLDAYTQSRF